jgi:glycosyltransferase A (GT-A) superfamily protein (DUF2064 family)
MTGAAVAVLLMADGSGSDEQERELERLLGRERHQRLRSVLVSDATTWGRRLAGDALHVAGPGDRLADATREVFASHDGPLLVVWPCLPRLRPEHATGAIGDLAARCDVVLGPVIDGGLYLLGLARPIPALSSLLEEQWRGPDAMTSALTTAREAGLEVGLLRAERALQSPADVRAALVDPMTAKEIVGICRGFDRTEP